MSSDHDPDRRSADFANADERAFGQFVVASGYKFSRETYLPEERTQADGWRCLDVRVGEEIMAWQRAFPEVQKQVLVCLGVLCAPPESLNLDPAVDYKVWQDMQFRFLATHPALFGVWGVSYVFRAKGRTATLTVSDWASDREPGGPVGQELFFTFMELQPYLEESGTEK